ncbi:MAG: hypothetical protein E7448_02975 [Ruminococcaceae bacterium]|nr:hypothetical protein [Oscillospiraceae bacterium]
MNNLNLFDSPFVIVIIGSILFLTVQLVLCFKAKNIFLKLIPMILLVISSIVLYFFGGISRSMGGICIWRPFCFFIYLAYCLWFWLGYLGNYQNRKQENPVSENTLIPQHQTGAAAYSYAYFSFKYKIASL